jgi:hypothetical protein
VPGPEVWKEVYRVLKPGGHIAAFAGSRTHDLMSMALRLAGFENRDTIMWVYGSGFPKSMDVSKAIDKAGGGSCMQANDRKEFAVELREKRESNGISRSEMASWFPYSEVTKNWERTDDGFRVPSEKDYQTLVERLGISETWTSKVKAEDKRRIVSETLQDRRKDGSVIGLGHSGVSWEATTDIARQWDGWGTALKPAFEPIILFRKPLEGTVAQNVIEWGTGGINIDECRVPLDGDYKSKANGRPSQTGLSDNYDPNNANIPDTVGRFPANFVHDGSDEVLELFPDSNGAGKSLPQVKVTGYGDKNTGTGKAEYLGGERIPFESGFGSASRFFYCAKASKSDRDAGMNEVDEYNLIENIPETILDEIKRQLNL